MQLILCIFQSPGPVREGKTKNHGAGSLEMIVENLVPRRESSTTLNSKSGQPFFFSFGAKEGGSNLSSSTNIRFLRISRVVLGGNHSFSVGLKGWFALGRSGAVSLASGFVSQDCFLACLVCFVSF